MDSFNNNNDCWYYNKINIVHNNFFQPYIRLSVTTVNCFKVILTHGTV